MSSPMPGSMPAFVARPDVAAPPGMERVYCAFHIPYLPAPLPPRAGVEPDPADLARGMLRAQAGVIGALARWREQAFALRFMFRPDTGAVTIAVLVRALAPHGQGVALAGEMSRDLARLLATTGIASTPVTTDAEVFSLLIPPGQNYIAEVRQQEEVVALHAGGAYAVAPFRPPLATWQPVFEQLTRQPAPCVLNIHLQPASLLPAEQAVFQEAAGLAHALEDFQHHGYSSVVDRDPLAGVVGALYAGYLSRFTAPFLVVVQVASPDYRAVQAIAAALVPELSERVEVRAAQASGTLPAGAQVVIPQSAPDAALAQQTLTLLELWPWGDSASRPEQRRLPFLMDAATAAAAFRFPVAVAGRIPGIATQAVVPGVDGRPAGKVFLSYRRGDSAGITGRIYDRLAARYGKDAIFRDLDSIPLGAGFMALIRQSIQQSAVQLVLIGPTWAEATGEDGMRRLDNPHDPVRQEVETGLSSQALVIPILLDGAPVPAPDRLPESLRPLLALNSQPVRTTDFDHDIERLIAAIDDRMRLSRP